jgi:delta 1-pyrroline-5-carboxylate dehydrogenase
MNKLITTEGFITDKQLVRKLGKAGILLSYYIDCYKFYADESGVFYRSRSDIKNDTSISYESQQVYEKQLVKLELLEITYGNIAQSNRIKLHPESIILYRNAQTTSVAAQTTSVAAQTDSVAAQTTSVAAQTISLVNERTPTNEPTEEITDVQLIPYEPSITLSHFDIKNIQTLSSGAIATSSIYSKLSPEDVEYYKNFKLN